MLVTSDTVDNSSPQKTDEIEPDLFITVYGGKKAEVDQSFKNHIGEDDSHSYQTWVNISVLKRFGNLFGGSVESAGGVTDLLVLMAITVIIIGLFFLWQVVIFFIVIVVLAVLSGGSALKFIKGTFIEANADRIDSLKLDNFVKEQVGKGYFVDLRSEEIYELEPFTSKTLSATTTFKWGIYISLIVATFFVIVELAYYFIYHFWQTDILALSIFGVLFLVGVLMMDIGVLLRRNSEKSLPSGGSD